MTSVQPRPISPRYLDFLCPLLVLIVACVLYGVLFNRETTLSYSIGYNLYGAERILHGEIPYRDFHTLYPPATVYLNAGLFRVLGTGLYTALGGVLVFKVLTVVAIYFCGRLAMTPKWAAGGALFATIWLRPNGPFKAVPMHYGALFLALALFCILAGTRKGSSPAPERQGTNDSKGQSNLAYFLAGGVMLGLLALFKHNIGAYAFAGLLVLSVLPAAGLREIATRRRLMRPAAMIVGFCAAVAPVLIFLTTRGALRPMIRSLLFGPGEFLINRLAAVPSPKGAAIAFILVGALGAVVYALRESRVLTIAILATSLLVVVISLWRIPQDYFDSLVFYMPIVVIGASFIALVARGSNPLRFDAKLFGLLAVSAAAFMEAFPRFAREQAIAATPFVLLLLVYLIYRLWPLATRFDGGKSRPRTGLALAVAPAILLVIGARLFHSSFMDGAHLRSDTPLAVDRGRGVYFPAEKAAEIDEVVRYLQQLVPPDGYFFAQSYAGSSLLFLADRKNPSGAQFWGGVGVAPAEKARTLEAIQNQGVDIVVTSERDQEAERYLPMKDYLQRNFVPVKQAGEVLILERRDPDQMPNQ